MTLESLTKIRHESSRAVNAENPTGEPGKGGIAASELGPSRKGSPCLRNIPVGATATLADITGPGCIRHIWITVDEKTTDADCFVLCCASIGMTRRNQVWSVRLVTSFAADSAVRA